MLVKLSSAIQWFKKKITQWFKNMRTHHERITVQLHETSSNNTCTSRYGLISMRCVDSTVNVYHIVFRHNTSVRDKTFPYASTKKHSCMEYIFDWLWSVCVTHSSRVVLFVLCLCSRTKWKQAKLIALHIDDSLTAHWQCIIGNCFFN